MTRAWSSIERARFFDEIPSGVVVMDPELSVVDHNRAFENIFGDCRGKLCYEATKDRDTICPTCPALATFKDDRARIIESSGTDRDGNVVHYLVHFSPVIGDGGHTDFVAAITTDLTANKRLQREYQTLFENVPCFVAVINRDHRVVKANKAFGRVFGKPTGERCFRLYKKRHEPCPECPVDRTFRTGESFTSHQMGVSRDGTATPYLVSTAPLFGMAFSTLLLVIGSTTTSTSGDATGKVYERIVQMMVAVVYVVTAFGLVERYRRAGRRAR